MKQFWQKCKAYVTPARLSRLGIAALVIAVVIAVNAVTYALTSTLGLYLYDARGLDLTLSDAPEAALSRAAEEGDTVTVLFCQAEDDVRAHATGANVYETAKQMAERFPSLIELEFVNIVIHPERVAAYRDEENGQYVSSTSVIFIHGENYRILTTVNNSMGYIDFYTLDTNTGAIVAYNGEEVLTAGVLWVLQDEHKKVYFTEGHFETATLTLTSLLGNAGYSIGVLDLHSEEGPSDAEMVVISNPMQDFEKAGAAAMRAELDRLESYMDRGGTVLAMLDPSLKEDLSNLKGFLATYGITVTASEAGEVGLVRDTTGAVSTDGMSVQCRFGTGTLATRLREEVETYADGSVKLPWTGALTLDASLGAEALLTASPTSVLYAGGEVIDREGSYALVGYGEREREGQTSRVVVVPSAYLTESGAMISNGYANRDFLYALLASLDEDAGIMPMNCRMALITDTTLENLTLGTARWITAAVLTVPVALGVVGFVILLRRRLA